MMANTLIKFNNPSTSPLFNQAAQRRPIHHIGPHLPISHHYPIIKSQSPSIKFNQYTTSNFQGQFQQVRTFAPQLSSTISFGNNTQTIPAQPIRISFNQHEYKSASFEPQPYSPQPKAYDLQSQPYNQQRQFININQQSKRPQLVENPSRLLKETRSSRNLKGEVKTFNVDTSDVKTIKQNQFIGCFHCFSPVTYSTQHSKIC